MSRALDELRCAMIGDGVRMRTLELLDNFVRDERAGTEAVLAAAQAVDEAWAALHIDDQMSVGRPCAVTLDTLSAAVAELRKVRP